MTRPPPLPPHSPSPLVGLTRETCADACSENACALADGRSLCFHPCKGGVPQLLKNDPAIQLLEAQAREMLGLRPPVLKGAA